MEWKPHVTVAAVIKKDNKYLLVEERANNTEVINQPAGHLEADESLLDAVKREVLEETGGIFVPESLVGIYHFKNESDNYIYIRFCFYGLCNSFDPNRELDKEIIRTLWLTKDQVNSYQDKLRTPVVLRCIDDFESGKCYSLGTINSEIRNITR